MLGLVTAGVGGEERSREGEQHPQVCHEACVIGVTAATTVAAAATRTGGNLATLTSTPAGAHAAPRTSTELTAAATFLSCHGSWCDVPRFAGGGESGADLSRSGRE